MRLYMYACTDKFGSLSLSGIIVKYYCPRGIIVVLGVDGNTMKIYISYTCLTYFPSGALMYNKYHVGRSEFEYKINDPRV